MNPERAQIKQSIVEQVKREIALYNAGEIRTLSTYDQLGERFGLSPRSKGNKITGYLEEAGILDERRVIARSVRFKYDDDVYHGKRFDKEIELAPSRDTAVLIGMLAGAAEINRRKGRIIFSTADDAVLDRYVAIAGDVVQKVPGIYAFRVNDKGKTYRRVSFYSKRHAIALGDLSRTKWVDTVLERHSWILQNPGHTWGLLEGFFDTKGWIRQGKKSKTNSLKFNAAHDHVATFLIDTLTSLGINNPKLNKHPDKPGQIRGINITNVSDLVHLANNIHSQIPEYEARFQQYRDYEHSKIPQKPQRSPIVKARDISEQELLNEWSRLDQLLGRPPNTKDIRQLKPRGMTKFTCNVYAKRFGNGSFRDIASTIANIGSIREIAQRLEIPLENMQPTSSQDKYAIDVNVALRQRETTSGRDVRYIPKVHRPIEDHAKQRVKELFGNGEQLVSSNHLLDQNGRSLLLWHGSREQYEQSNALQTTREEIEIKVTQLTKATEPVAFTRQEPAKLELGQVDGLSTTKEQQDGFDYVYRSGAMTKLSELQKDNLLPVQDTDVPITGSLRDIFRGSIPRLKSVANQAIEGIISEYPDISATRILGNGNTIKVATNRDALISAMVVLGAELRKPEEHKLTDTDVLITGAVMEELFIGSSNDSLPKVRQVIAELLEHNPDLVKQVRRGPYVIYAITDKDVLMQEMAKKGIKRRGIDVLPIQENDFIVTVDGMSKMFIGFHLNTWKDAKEALEEMSKENPDSVATRINNRRKLTVVTDKEVFIMKMLSKGRNLRDQLG